MYEPGLNKIANLRERSDDHLSNSNDSMETSINTDLSCDCDCKVKVRMVVARRQRMCCYHGNGLRDQLKTPWRQARVLETNWLIKLGYKDTLTF